MLTRGKIKLSLGEYITLIHDYFYFRLFTKLFTLLRLKTKCFGADVNVTVSCLKCLIECLDIKAIVKISYAEDFVRVRLMPFFAFCADDLNLLIRNLNSGRYSHIKVSKIRQTIIGKNLITSSRLVI